MFCIRLNNEFEMYSSPMMTMDADQSPPSSPFHGFQLGSRPGADSPEEESPFHGFSNADIPQPIIIKTEPGKLRV